MYINEKPEIKNIKFSEATSVSLKTTSLCKKLSLCHHNTKLPTLIIMHKHFRDPPPSSVITQYVNAPLVVLLSGNFIIA